jgi:peptide/nickel transport system permease protein
VTAATSEPADTSMTTRRLQQLYASARAHKLAAIGALWLVVLIVCVIAAPLVAPYKPLDQDLNAVLSGPSWSHPLGTDELGRDVLSRILYGGRLSLLAVTEALAAWLFVGALAGLAAGFAGGWVDRLIARVGELVFALPAIIILLVVLAVFPNNEQVAMVTFGLIASAGLFRVVRAATLSVRQETYIDAAQVAGLSRTRIVFRHVLPRIRGLLVVQAALFLGVALVTEVGLAFLGFGPQPPSPSWGGLVADASNVLQRQVWLLIPPSMLIVFTILALGFVAEALRDILAASWSPRTPALTKRHPSTDADGSVTALAPVRPHGNGLLSLRGLSVAFEIDGRLCDVVQDVSLEIQEGETVGLVGESGSGKTITALSTLGLLPGNATLTHGTCDFDGRRVLPVGGPIDGLRGREVGYVSQDPMTALDPNFTVAALLGEAIRRHLRVGSAVARARTLQLLEQVDLPDPARIARLRPFELSGGMAQRVAIALALAGEPRLLIADEPTTALDVTVQGEILTLFRRLQQERGLAILLVSHDWGVVASICHRAAVMYAGQIVEEGDVDSLFASPRHPYTEGLLAANPHLAERGRPLTVIPGSVPAPKAWPEHCHFAERCSHVTDACLRGPVPMFSIPNKRTSRCVVRAAQTPQEVIAR